MKPIIINAAQTQLLTAAQTQLLTAGPYNEIFRRYITCIVTVQTIFSNNYGIRLKVNITV